MTTADTVQEMQYSEVGYVMYSNPLKGGFPGVGVVKNSF